jgi:hypothetical protein
MRATHALTHSGRSTAELSEAVRPVKEQLARALARLDGEERFSLVLWRLPAGKTLLEVDMAVEPQEYLQCAGSAERMTVELRELEGGVARQYVVGRLPAEQDGAPGEVVPWSDFKAVVYPNEVFAADEAAELFGQYLDTHAVEPTYHLRPLQLG